MKCRCRKCGTLYAPADSGARYRGYCSQGCLSAMARATGFSQRHWERARSERGVYDAFEKSDYAVLLRAGLIGSVVIRDEKIFPPQAADGAAAAGGDEED